MKHLEKALRDLLDGHVCLTEGVRGIVQWRFSNHGLPEELFQLLVGVESETDAFPIGAVREQWEASSLAQADAKRESAEAFYRESVIQDAAALLQATLAMSSNNSFNPTAGVGSVTNKQSGPAAG